MGHLSRSYPHSRYIFHYSWKYDTVVILSLTITARGGGGGGGAPRPPQQLLLPRMRNYPAWATTLHDFFFEVSQIFCVQLCKNGTLCWGITWPFVTGGPLRPPPPQYKVIQSSKQLKTVHIGLMWRYCGILVWTLGLSPLCSGFANFVYTLLTLTIIQNTNIWLIQHQFYSLASQKRQQKKN